MSGDDRWAIFDHAGEEVLRWVERYRCGERVPGLPAPSREAGVSDGTSSCGFRVARDRGFDGDE